MVAGNLGFDEVEGFGAAGEGIDFELGGVRPEGVELADARFGEFLEGLEGGEMGVEGEGERLTSRRSGTYS